MEQFLSNMSKMWPVWTWLDGGRELQPGQPKTEAVRGWLHLGSNQDDKDRRSLGLCCVRSTAKRRWSRLEMGRKISEKQSLTAEDTEIMESANIR